MQQQRKGLKISSLIVGVAMLFAVGCGGNGGGHTHTFDQKVQDEAYLKSEKTCTSPKQYYYSCACGEKGEETFTVGSKGLHSYTAEVASEEYLVSSATCQKQAVYYISCEYCGQSSNISSKTFSSGELGDHVYNQSVASEEYLATEATATSAATYYKSCVCGLKGTETFSHGSPLPEITDEDKAYYEPVSLTMTLYYGAESVYGFTYNTQNQPIRPVIQIEEGNVLTENAQEFSVTSKRYSSYGKNESGGDITVYYYVAKGQADLEPSTTYTYRVYDKYAEVGSTPVTFTTKDAKSTAFSFSHVSDTQSQSTADCGAAFRGVLRNIDADTTDFLLHTGDVVEYSMYEYEWTSMLHGNFEYLSKIPVMAVSGNHDTTYKAGSNELIKHFNHNVPAQTSTANGYYYSFTYGNAKFIMLNTNNNGGSGLEKAQYDWLINELENNDCTWTFVAMHAPLYSVGKWGSDSARNGQSRALRTQLQGIFAQYGVDIVFQGHDHLASRTKALDGKGNATTESWVEESGVSYSVDPDGVIYVMDGTAGSSGGAVTSVADGIYYYAQTVATQSWADITIEGNKLTLALKYYSGGKVNTLKTWGIKKS